MDFSLVSEQKRRKHYADKGSYSAQDEKGHLIINTDMDVPLLMVYGQILFTGGSYTYALSKSRILVYTNGSQLTSH